MHITKLNISQSKITVAKENQFNSSIVNSRYIYQLTCETIITKKKPHCLDRKYLLLIDQFASFFNIITPGKSLNLNDPVQSLQNQ